MKQQLLLALATTFIVCSCSVSKKIDRTAKTKVINAKELQSAHVGISIFEPASGKYLYNYQGDKYFVPASNTKLPTLYAGLKYLGDSLPGLRYEFQQNDVIISGTGDPTFLHPDFKQQPVYEFLQKAAVVSYLQDDLRARFAPLGNGWTWNDYGADYAPERSEMPMYGNVARFFIRNDTIAVMPKAFYNSSIQWKNQTLKNGVSPWFTIQRPYESNAFYSLYSASAYSSKTKFISQAVPFKTNPEPNGPFQNRTFMMLLADTLKRPINITGYVDARYVLKNILYSQPTDSMLKPLMHRSDNFFAEQTLLMASNELLGVMNEARLIDTLLKTDFKDLPHKPRWADGSGLSRYNLFTPQDFVVILDKLKNEFGMERLKEILPTGNEGTLRNFYVSDSNYLFAKTGTLSGVVALSGYMYTAKGKLLLFSVLVNNHQASAVTVRRAVEAFVQEVRRKY